MHIIIHRYSRGTGTIWLTNVECSSDDSTLLDCSYSSFGHTSCSHCEDVAIHCSPGKCPN